MMDDVDTIPNDHVPEWYAQQLQKNIIPGKRKSVNDDDDDDGPIPLLERGLSAKDKCNGQVMTFSFQVDAADEIKCYIVWNGQMS